MSKVFLSSVLGIFLLSACQKETPIPISSQPCTLSSTPQVTNVSSCNPANGGTAAKCAALDDTTLVSTASSASVGNCYLAPGPNVYGYASAGEGPSDWYVNQYGAGCNANTDGNAIPYNDPTDASYFFFVLTKGTFTFRAAISPFNSSGNYVDGLGTSVAASALRTALNSGDCGF